MAKDQLRFLRQASQQMVGAELLAGKVCGYDVAGLLIMAAIAEAVAATEAQACSALLAEAAALEVGAFAELGARILQDCWWREMGESVTAGLDSLRSQGEKIIGSTYS